MKIITVEAFRSLKIGDVLEGDALFPNLTGEEVVFIVEGAEEFHDAEGRSIAAYWYGVQVAVGVLFLEEDGDEVYWEESA